MAVEQGFVGNYMMRLCLLSVRIHHIEINTASVPTNMPVKYCRLENEAKINKSAVDMRHFALGLSQLRNNVWLWLQLSQ
jgi:hypothetical protein